MTSKDKKKEERPKKIVAQNKKARFEYFIEDVIEAGIVLLGSEVKSIREGKVSINDSYVAHRGKDLYLQNSHVSEYKGANQFNHEPLRLRKLLLNRKEINKLMGKITAKGYTVVPLTIYFNEKNKIKVEIALAKGKAHADKRASIKEREWKVEKARVLRNRDRD